MGSKRRKNENIVNKCILRQVHGGTVNAQFPHSCLQPNLDLTRLCIPLCDIQKDNSFAVGHVLLGFTKCGEYLMSYYNELQDYVSFGLPITTYKYTLHWWKFNLRRPLQQVCHVSLFVGEVITEDLLLIVCHTLNDNRIVVHGYPSRDEQCRQCYVTICPSPPGTSITSLDDTWVVHMKYNLLPPFPLFVPPIQLKLKDTVVLNSVDSILAITVSPCAEHKTTKPNSRDETCEENCRSTYCMDGIVADSKVDMLKKCSEKFPVSVKEVVGKLWSVSGEETERCIQETIKADDIPNINRMEPKEVEISNKDAPSQITPRSSCTEHNTCSESDSLSFNCNHSNMSNLVNNNQEIVNDIQSQNIGYNDFNSNKSVKDEECSHTISKSSHLSSFSFKTFFIGADSEIIENTSTSTIIDGTSYLDIQITTVADTPYKLLECLQDNVQMQDHRDHSTPCIHTRVVSLDVERSIIEALNTLEELKGKYWVLRNYSTLLVDVCESSQCVIVHIVVLISVQEYNATNRREISSFSLLLTWNIATGEVHTLSMSPFTKTMAKTDKQIFKEGSKIVADLQRKYFVPAGLSAVQAFSNHNVFTGKTLRFIKHPSQPITIVL